MNTNNEQFRLNQIIRKSSEGISKAEILSHFSETKKEFIEFLLEEGQDKNQLIVIGDKYYHIDNTSYRVGKYKDKKYNNRFVQIGNDSYQIDSDTNAIDEDTVLVSIVNKKQKIVHIEKVLQRELKSVYGEVQQIKDSYFLKPENPKFKKLVIKLDNNDGLIVGSKVVVNLDKEESENNYEGTVTGLIGYSNDPGIDILMEAYKYGIDSYFPQEAKEEAEQLPLSVSDKDKINRCDLTKKEIFTIDGDDTKDIDDAISLEVLPNGNYELGVHITDVTYYIEKGSALDEEAYHRGTSSYLAGKVIPMYPAIFSNGIGSLNPNQDRLTVTCLMEIDHNGNVVNYNIFESVINSNIQMTYNKVNDILDGVKVKNGYEEHVDTLKRMYKLSLILKKKRLKRGALNIERKELKIELDDKGFPTEFKIREQNNAENIIEEFMIAANETVATALEEYNYPAMYRIHEVPSPTKVSDFIEVINKIGMPYYRSERRNLQMEVQSIAQELTKYGVIGKIMYLPFVKTLKKARYQSENIGHFGLASKSYVHFTSPIRRYPDNTIHRSIKKYLLSHEEIDEEEIESDFLELTDEADYLSYRERQADKCEQAIISMKCAEYMEKHIGEKFNGRIVQIDNKGLTIQLDNLIEGRVKISSLPCHYEYNEETYSLVSLDDDYEDYYYGDLLEVEVYNANKENKTIEFEITKVLEQNEYVKPSINDNKRNEVINRSQRKIKRKDKRRTKWDY
ncbi:MAG: VacB/RNase II family 3'-5' exoribonuclease [Bacilli bacterium]|nr:VacB/RNase II family 3'-5' exoribonuclease [Bacilli bacterium]